ncbi:MAG: hypothetical protein ACI89W_001122 [Gammaproteobacteria bacterium]|jgi:hypothetical protein
MTRHNQNLQHNKNNVVSHIPNNKTIALKFSNLSPFSRPPLSALSLVFPSQDFTQIDIPDLRAKLLENMQHSITIDMAVHAQIKRFVCQDSMPSDSRYYEQIIFEEHIIPTRIGSWHDFFNGIIWLQYPKTKNYLNRLHISEINAHGLNPRTQVRNHITHFDECGVVLFVHGSTLLARLHLLFEMQEWNTLFCELKDEWNNSIFPVVFGHANLEMLLTPFIGLTGKVLLIQIDEKPLVQAALQNRDKSIVNQASISSGSLDTLLFEYIQSNKTFNTSKPFYPLPLLGVPHWHYAEQGAAFYANKDYFMPRRQIKGDTD